MYQPHPDILNKYADVMVNFALWDGRGVRKGDVVCIAIPDSAKLFLVPLQNAVLNAGAHPVLDYRPDSTEGLHRSFFECASYEQVCFYPKKYMIERLRTCDHLLIVLATNDKHHLKGVDSKKLMARREAGGFYFKERLKQEKKGKLSWTICLFGTDAMARDVDMTPEAYWKQIINACYLDEADPVAKWKSIDTQIHTLVSWINAFDISTLHIAGEDVDLRISFGEKRTWLGGGGRNIPSFEIFTSPDWRGAEGWIRFNQPLYRYGTRISGIELVFKDGVVVQACAKENEQLLKDMISIPGMDKIGEFSLTDKRLSRIDAFMGETLYDENAGGQYGNTHIALGKSFHDAYDGSYETVSEKEFEELGFNDSPEHVDIISTTDRVVTATLASGEEKVIYKDGEFLVELS